jgi:hypothetical protein
VPTTSCGAQGFTCGSINNGCGSETCGTMSGACASGLTCLANHCCLPAGTQCADSSGGDCSQCCGTPYICYDNGAGYQIACCG